MNKKTYLYILMNKRNTTMYIGVSNDVVKRIVQHQREKRTHFTSKYNTDKLVYYEEFEEKESAYRREKQLKNWHREWKFNLVRSVNPSFDDFTETLKQVQGQ